MWGFTSYFGLLVLSLLASSSICEIYLAPYSAVTWTGDCSTSICTSVDPCSIPLSLVTDIGTSCNITLLEGNYAPQTLSWETPGQTALRVKFQGSVSNLELTFSIGSGTVQFLGSPAAELAWVTFDVVSNTAATLNVANLTLQDYAIFARGAFSRMDISRCNLSETTRPSRVEIVEGVDVLFKASYVFLNVSTFIKSTSGIAAQIIGMHGEVGTLIQSSTSLLDCYESALTISDWLADSQTSFDLIVAHSNFTKTGGHVVKWSPNPPSIVQVVNSILRGFELSYNTSIFLERTQLIDCTWEIVDTQSVYTNKKKF